MDKKLLRISKFAGINGWCQQPTPKDIGQSILQQCTWQGSLFKYTINMDWNAFKAMFITGFRTVPDYQMFGVPNDDSIPPVVNIVYKPPMGYSDALKHFFGIKLQNKQGDRFDAMDIVYLHGKRTCKILFSSQKNDVVEHFFNRFL